MAGGSTGSVVSAIGKSLLEIPARSSIAFFVSDSGERYLDTILFQGVGLRAFPLGVLGFIKKTAP